MCPPPVERDALRGRIPSADIKSAYPHPDFVGTVESDPLLLARTIGFYWKRHIPAGGELSSALVELASESASVDGSLVFRAVEVVEEDKATLIDIFAAEAHGAASLLAQRAQAQAQTSLHAEVVEQSTRNERR